eukprot:Hpha_TRINITY_DN35086_c0_g1::TRINITY_DN35086_c0_g1_i1::g.82666::m.82666
MPASQAAASPPPARRKCSRIFWLGPHSVFGSHFASPLGRLPKRVLRRLVAEHGWREVGAADGAEFPLFSFSGQPSAKHGPDPTFSEWLEWRRGGGSPRHEKVCGDTEAGTFPVCQLPPMVTEQLDCKAQLWRVLCAAGRHELMPPSWEGAEFLAAQGTEVEQQGEGGRGCEERDDNSGDQRSPASPADPATTDPSAPLYFVKHRLGCKGRSVYFFASAAKAAVFLRTKDASSLGDWIVQREVWPRFLELGALLDEHPRSDGEITVPDHNAPDAAVSSGGRKFVLRAHALATFHGDRSWRFYAHNDVIATENAGASGTGAKASVAEDAHITAKNLKHARCLALRAWNESSRDGDGTGTKVRRVSPWFLREVLPQVHRVVGEALRAAFFGAAGRSASEQVMLPPGLCLSPGEEFAEAARSPKSNAKSPDDSPSKPSPPPLVRYHLFGFDLMLNALGRVFLLEVNANPAIASGTFQYVDDKSVYDKLLWDMCGLILDFDSGGGGAGDVDSIGDGARRNGFREV